MLLHRELLPRSVRWNHRLLSYAEGGAGGEGGEGGEGGLELKFEGGATAHVDALVGADGIFSAVRQQKLGEGRDSLRYLGVMVRSPVEIACCDSASEVVPAVDP